VRPRRWCARGGLLLASDLRVAGAVEPGGRRGHRPSHAVASATARPSVAGLGRRSARRSGDWWAGGRTRPRPRDRLEPSCRWWWGDHRRGRRRDVRMVGATRSAPVASGGPVHRTDLHAAQHRHRPAVRDTDRVRGLHAHLPPADRRVRPDGSRTRRRHAGCRPAAPLEVAQPDNGALPAASVRRRRGTGCWRRDAALGSHGRSR
jgi:hypothetical protein